MWHGGAHHIGYDVHDAVRRPEILAPNMVFCVDVGVYHEEWGIGFRLEDNCLITEDGCENLSAAIPRTVGGHRGRHAQKDSPMAARHSCGFWPPCALLGGLDRLVGQPLRTGRAL